MVGDYHEPPEELSAEARDIHRAIRTLIEELEAVDWYHQRIELCKDDELRATILHHRDEEIEHSAMSLEWLRRHMDKFDEELRTYLFTSTFITNIEEEEEEGGEEEGGPASPDLGIGSLRD
jgi:hypothetical protein